MEEIIIETLADLVEFIKGASPVIWEASLRQVTANIVADIFIIAVLVVLAAVGIKYGVLLVKKGMDISQENKISDKSYYDRTDPDTAYVPGAMLLIMAMGCTIAIFVMLPITIKMIVNPEYYAIRDIMYLIPMP